MNTALRLGIRYSLYSVYAAFKLHATINTGTGNLKNNFFKTT